MPPRTLQPRFFLIHDVHGEGDHVGAEVIATGGLATVLKGAGELDPSDYGKTWWISMSLVQLTTYSLPANTPEALFPPPQVE